MDSIREVRGMGEIDKTIDDICSWIEKEIKENTVNATALSNMIFALAELVKARANITFKP